MDSSARIEDRWENHGHEYRNISDGPGWGRDCSGLGVAIR